MQQAQAINLLAAALWLGLAAPAAASSSSVSVSQPKQLAQTQPAAPDRTEDYQNRLREAKTPEERACIQAEYERMMQQGAVPAALTNRPAHGTNYTGGAAVGVEREGSSESSGGGSSSGGSSGGEGGSGSE